MTATFAEAQTDIFSLFKAAWDTTGFIALYPNVGGKIPTGSDPWARVTLQTVDGGQTAFGDSGIARFGRTGIFVAQIFVPKGEGLNQGYVLAKVVADAYDGVASPLGTWFRNGRINEVGPDGEWFQINFLVDFEYDELK